MATITLKKKKPAAVQTAPQTQKTQLDTLVDAAAQHLDEYEKAKKRIADEKLKMKPFEDAMAAVQEHVNDTLADNDVDPDQPHTFGTESFLVEAGKAGTRREIADMAKLRELLGDETFLSVAKVNMGDVDAYLTPPQKEQVVKSSRGERKVTLKRKPRK